MIDHRTRGDSAGKFSSNRLFEWIMAIMMIQIALTLALPGDTLGRGALRLLQSQIGLGESFVAVILASIGVLRCSRTETYRSMDQRRARLGPRSAR